MIEVRIDTRRLNAAMQEFARESRKELDVVVRQQAGIMVGHLIALTPPAAGMGQAMSDTGAITLEAKKRGEGTIAADIAVLFPTTKLAEGKVRGMIDAGWEWGTGSGKKTIREFAENIGDLERIHRFARSPASGRVRTGRTGQNMALTRAAVRKAYTKQAIKKVGLLAAGWIAAARELRTVGRATPAWITRHGKQPGGVSITRTTEGISVKVANRVAYFPKDMPTRVQRAVIWRERGLRRALEAMLDRRAKKANARMGS